MCYLDKEDDRINFTTERVNIVTTRVNELTAKLQEMDAAGWKIIDARQGDIIFIKENSEEEKERRRKVYADLDRILHRK